MLNLDPIRERFEKATQGPWYWHSPTNLRVDDGDVNGDVFITLSEWEPRQNDANFIANAPTDIVALIAEVERLQRIEKAANIVKNAASGSLDDIEEAVGVLVKTMQAEGVTADD